jgi:hypothetical protein
VVVARYQSGSVTQLAELRSWAVAHISSPELLVLHGLRLKGVADVEAVAQRFALNLDLVQELLLDYEAFGWISRVSFADINGWALTGSGRAENERCLSVELDQTGARSEVVAAHDVFIALNSHFLTAVTNWQIRPDRADPLAANDHTDWRWDQSVVDDLQGCQIRFDRCASSSRLRCSASPGTPNGTQRLWRA